MKKASKKGLLLSLKEYFENTPQNIIDKEWEEMKYLNENGVDVNEYVKQVKAEFYA